jgi:hypothetical protein
MNSLLEGIPGLLMKDKKHFSMLFFVEKNVSLCDYNHRYISCQSCLRKEDYQYYNLSLNAPVMLFIVMRKREENKMIIKISK